MKRSTHLKILQLLSLFFFGYFVYHHCQYTFNSHQKVASFAYYDVINKKHFWNDKLIDFPKDKLKVETVLKAYLLGPVDPLFKSAFPPGTAINSIHYLRGELFVDFQSSIFKSLSKQSEKKFIYSFLLTLKKNAHILEPIGKIYFTFGGRTIPYIKGSFDYRQGFSLKNFNFS